VIDLQQPAERPPSASMRSTPASRLDLRLRKSLTGICMLDSTHRRAAPGDPQEPGISGS
jgi:hypothetical protein